jgi:hypothetical protein
MSDTTSTKRRLPIPKDARIKTYYDTQPVKQNQAVINFFPPNASKDVTRNNYIQNPFSGDNKRRVAGLSFEPVSHFLINDPDNGIDVRAIVNALKYAGIVVTADQNYTQFLRAPIGEYSNFAETEYEEAAAKAYVNSAYVDKTVSTAIVKRSAMYRLHDPFDIASGQNLNMSVHFKDASAFPTEAQWQASGQKKLWLRATLYLAEIEVN